MSAVAPAELSAKRAALRLIERLDDDVSYEAILYELHFLQQVERGLHDVEAGRTTLHEALKDDPELKRWLG